MSIVHEDVGKELQSPGSLTPRRLRRVIGRVAAVMIAVALTLAAAEAQQPPRGARPADATEKLFEAVYADDFEASQAAIAAGADVAAKDTWGLTPVDIAIDKGYFEIAHFLLSVRNFQNNERPQQATRAPERPSASKPAVQAAAQPKAERRSRSETKAKPEAASKTPTGPARSASASKSGRSGSVVVTKSGFSLPAELIGAPAPSASKATADKTAANKPTATRPVAEKKAAEARPAAKSQTAPRRAAEPSTSAAKTSPRVAAKPSAKPKASPAPELAAAAAPLSTPWPEDEPHPFDPSTPVPGALPAAGPLTPQPGAASAD